MNKKSKTKAIIFLSETRYNKLTEKLLKAKPSLR